MRHLATLSLVYLLRLTNQASFFLTSSTTATTVLLATACIGVSVIQVADASPSSDAAANSNNNSNNDDSGETKQLTAGKLRSLGEVALSERKFANAESYYKQAIKVEPTNAINYYKLYSVHKRMRSLSDALSSISHAVELDDKEKVDWRVQKAKLLVNLGRCEEAALEYAEARKLSKNEKEAKTTFEGYNEANDCAELTQNAMTSYQSEDWSNAVLYFNKVLAYTLDTRLVIYEGTVGVPYGGLLRCC